MIFKKLKNKSFSIDLGIYPYTIFVCFGKLETAKQVLENYRYTISKEGVDKILTDVKELIKDCNAKTIQFENGNIFIWIACNEYKKDPSYYANVIAHESLHATQMVMSHIGFEDKIDEPHCYLHGYIVEKIFEQI